MKTLSLQRTTGGTLAKALAASGLLLLAGAAEAADPAGPAKLEYNRDIRPILADNCFRCHGPDSASRKADLRLDRREAAVEKGAIEPGKPDESLLIDRVFTADPKELMPPPTTKKVLTQAQKETLKRWVESGAEYQAHWSLIPPKKPSLPAVKNEGWVRNPVDRFILSALESSGLTPAPEADRRTLARRLSLDLTGLPPAPDVVEAFVADKSADAYEKLVDRFLASDRWGEHRGRYWLDAARYADTHGIHFDNYREMWAYRDWVIRAFNANLPFDRFTLEQIAGDLLPNRTLDQLVASGFNRCNITTNEGGTIPEEYAVLYTRDRTETVSQVWLGLTANCSVCHDHKFDPLPQREFYEMAAFFNNTTQNPMDGNIKDTPPNVFVPSAEDRAKAQAIAAEIASVKSQFEARRKTARPEFDRWLAGPVAGSVGESLPAEGLRVLLPLSEGEGGLTAVIEGGAWRQVETGPKPLWQPGHVGAKALSFRAGVNISVPEAGDFEKDQPFSYGAWVQMPKRPQNGGSAALARMDESNDYRGWDLWIENGKPAAHIIHRWPDDALKVVAKNPLPVSEWSHVFVTYDGSGKASGVSIYVNGRLQPVDVAEDRLKSTIRTTTPFRLAQRSGAGARFNGITLQDVRIYGRHLKAAEVDRVAKGTRVLFLASKPKADRTDVETTEVFDWYLASRDADFQALAARLAKLEVEQADIAARGTIALVMQEKPEPPAAFVLYRGEYDKRRDPVKPDTPNLLPPMPPDLPRNRLGFARWLLLPEQPTVARVTVNRFWQELFGTGLVRTAGDFGVSGELPSHPELLDWLAVDFREHGWDVKRFFKMLVTSAAYRQSAVTTPEKIERDPQNRLLAHGPRFRMDAEMVRDYALAASGLLSSRIGGPSVKPYMPEGVWEAVAMIGSNTRDYRARPRRGGCIVEACTRSGKRAAGDRWRSSTPRAARPAPCARARTRRSRRLVTLNDPQFVEAARLSPNWRSSRGLDLRRPARLRGGPALARPFRPEELAVAGRRCPAWPRSTRATPPTPALLSVGESPYDSKLDPATLAAWTMLCNELMNLDEALNK
ncbi:MAG: DUF1549 domain-containing protein [Isosphaeraceae bacterium]